MKTLLAILLITLSVNSQAEMIYRQTAKQAEQKTYRECITRGGGLIQCNKLALDHYYVCFVPNSLSIKVCDILATMPLHRQH